MKTQRIYRASYPPYLTSQPLYLCHHTDCPHLCIDVSLYWWHHNKCVSHHTWNTYDIIPNLHPITFTLYDMNDHVFDITYTEFMTSDLLSMTSYPLFRTSHHFMYDMSSRPLYLCHHTQPIDDITATTCKVLHAVYMWYHIPYVCDKISTKYDITTLCVDITTLTLGICLTSFALQMISHPLYHTRQRYLWCHIHFMHHITPLYQTLQPLFLCHHNLTTDITPTFKWHHTHLLCDILCPI